jgi:hypothetical protein
LFDYCCGGPVGSGPSLVYRLASGWGARAPRVVDAVIPSVVRSAVVSGLDASACVGRAWHVLQVQPLRGLQGLGVIVDSGVAVCEGVVTW